MSKEIQILLNKLHPTQQQVLNEAKRFNVLICGRRWGKSTMAINLEAEPALEGHPVGYFTPTYKLLEPTYKEIASALEPVIRRKHDNQFIELITGGVIEFWSLENPLAGRSRKYKRVVVDEAAFVKNLMTVWNECIRATLTDLKGDAWFMSTPKGKNDLFNLFCRGIDNEKWKSWQKPTLTNPFIDPTELEDAKIDMPNNAYLQEYEAQFLEDGTSVFMELPINDNPTITTKYYAGIDLGRADDWTVLTILNDSGQMVACERWRHTEWSNIVNSIIRVLNSWHNPNTLVEVNSIGDVVHELIKKKYLGKIEPFVTTSKSKQDIVEALQVAIQNKEFTSLTIEWLKKEFELFTYEYTHKTRSIKYSAPPGFHDDGVMSCAIAYNALKNLKTRGSYAFA